MTGNNNGGNDKGSNTGERGFAAMDADKQREIASKGGKAAHASGHAHEFTSEEAREAGQKGGQASHDGGNGGGGNGGNQSSDDQNSGTRGGTSEQHAEAGRQSHKND